MEKRFNLTLNEDSLSQLNEYQNEGNTILENLNYILKESEKNENITNSSFIDNDSKVHDGDEIKNLWFNTDGEYDIFLSHSHKDEKSIMSLAGYLEKELKKKVFIDSCIWKYSNDLLKKFDDMYCKKDNNCYDYNLRNQTTTHIHMMLATALNEMINKCKYFIFANTDNSVSIKTEDDNYTLSSWLFYELTVANNIKISSTLNENRNYYNYIPVGYKLDNKLKNFKKIKFSNLKEMIT